MTLHLSIEAVVLQQVVVNDDVQHKNMYMETVVMIFQQCLIEEVIQSKQKQIIMTEVCQCHVTIQN